MDKSKVNFIGVNSVAHILRFVIFPIFFHNFVTIIFIPVDWLTLSPTAPPIPWLPRGGANFAPPSQSMFEAFLGGMMKIGMNPYMILGPHAKD